MEGTGGNGAGELTSLGLQRVALDVWWREAMGLKLLSYFMRERGIRMSPIHCICWF